MFRISQRGYDPYDWTELFGLNNTENIYWTDRNMLADKSVQLKSNVEELRYKDC